MEGDLLKQRAMRRWNFKLTWPLHAMLIPGIVLVLIFSYLPMLGLVMAFQDYKPQLGF